MKLNRANKKYFLTRNWSNEMCGVFTPHPHIAHVPSINKKQGWGKIYILFTIYTLIY